jgi:hypothetical protein
MDEMGLRILVETLARFIDLGASIRIIENAMKKALYVLLAALALLAILLVRYNDFISMDVCLDMGGRWDKATKTCDDGRAGSTKR